MRAEPIPDGELTSNPDYVQALENSGFDKIQGNITATALDKSQRGMAFRLVTDTANPEFVGIVSIRDFSPFNHFAVSVSNSSGQWFNSMRGLFTGSASGAVNIYGLTGTCIQMSNSTLSLAGYAGNVLDLLKNNISVSTNVVGRIWGEQKTASGLNSYAYAGGRN